MISELVEKEWDFVVVGTGMGGGTIGRRLAESGFSVLFLDRGPSGMRTERQELDPGIHDPFARQIRGYWPAPVVADIDGRPSEFFGPLGAGIGGSSVFYAAALERPERHDLEDSESRPHPTGGWPTTYEQFRRYFQAVEGQYHVCGENDPICPEPPAPLKSAPPLSPGDALMMEDFRRSGLNPYRAHVAIRYLPGCDECIGIKCPRDCKMDARSAGVEPALATGNAALLDNCTVTAIRGGKSRIRRLEAIRAGERVSFRARQFILSCGALSSPRLLLASASEDWPEGCANESGLVGRNLMFHLNEMIAIWPSRQADFTGPAKTISMRDFYYRDGRRFGLFQSMGLGASYGNVVHFLNQRFDRSFLRPVRPLREFLRIPALIAVRIFGDARIFVGILEDMPYAQNRVMYDRDRPDAIPVRYAISPELAERRKAYRSAIRKGLRGQRSFFLNPDPELNYGHPCGTLRYGTDPQHSVLDSNCRAHSIENLHVVDSSFMPTSCGVNPSLMIAANALRVADALIERQA